MFTKSVNYKNLIKILVAVFALAALLAAKNMSAKADDKPTIDASQADKGIVTVSLPADADPSKFAVIIQASDGKENYVMKDKKESYAVVKDGTYKIIAAAMLGGNKVKPLVQEEISFKTTDATSRYLISTPQIRWNTGMKVIKDYDSMLGATKEALTTVQEMYKEMTTKYVYDDDKAADVTAGVIKQYVPDIEKIYKAKKGICYDYSAVFASAMRSVGIPCKMVWGFSPDVDVLHAWNQVFVGGKWITMDMTVDAAYVQAKQGDKVKMEKDASKYQITKIY